MGARYYVKEIGRFVSPDTLVPRPGDSQSYNRYAYVGNSPFNYSDPSGHLPTACDPVGSCTLDDDFDPDRTWVDEEGTLYETTEETLYGPVGTSIPDVPYRRRLSVGELDIGWRYYMPPGSNPKAQRGPAAQRLGMALNFAGLAFDAIELAEIFVTPLVSGDEQASAAWDVIVTGSGGFFTGENYFFERPHPDLPAVFSFNDDFFVTSGDLVISGLANRTLPAAGGLLAQERGALAGKVGASAVDVLTSGYSLRHDIRKTILSQPNSRSVGFSLSPDAQIVIIYWLPSD